MGPQSQMSKGSIRNAIGHAYSGKATARSASKMVRKEKKKMQSLINFGPKINSNSICHTALLTPVVKLPTCKKCFDRGNGKITKKAHAKHCSESQFQKNLQKLKEQDEKEFKKSKETLRDEAVAAENLKKNTKLLIVPRQQHVPPQYRQQYVRPDLLQSIVACHHQMVSLIQQQQQMIQQQQQQQQQPSFHQQQQVLSKLKYDCCEPAIQWFRAPKMGRCPHGRSCSNRPSKLRNI